MMALFWIIGLGIVVILEQVGLPKVFSLPMLLILGLGIEAPKRAAAMVLVGSLLLDLIARLPVGITGIIVLLGVGIIRQVLSQWGTKWVWALGSWGVFFVYMGIVTKEFNWWSPIVQAGLVVGLSVLWPRAGGNLGGVRVRGGR